MKDLLSSPLLVLSPHPDDAVLSCGGLLVQHSDAVVVTAFSGDAPEPRRPALARLALPALRRLEDARAMELLGCEHQILGLPDAIDRRDEAGHVIYASLPELFAAVLPADAARCSEIQAALKNQIGERVLLCPMAVGAHVDHQLCAHVGRRLAAEGHSVWFYEDAPYVFPETGSELQSDSVILAARRLRANIRGTWDLAISTTAKEEILACYSSQIDALFGDILTYSHLAQEHYESLGGELERFYLLRWPGAVAKESGVF
jgi:LmbE family N-acetylglucosaminyl deacetylase